MIAKCAVVMEQLAQKDETPIRPVDQLVLDLLRREEGLSIQDLMDRLEVTATAIRQRIDRLVDSGYIERRKQGVGRGRPSFTYFLTDKGWRQAGVTYSELAISLWSVIQTIESAEVKSQLINRVADRMGVMFRTMLPDAPLEERMRILAGLLNNRKVPSRVCGSEALPILEVQACPYPDLVNDRSDRSVCELEQKALSAALGHPVELSQCRLDGHTCCQFTATRPTPIQTQSNPLTLPSPV
jgi:predicted ArsR family transcriptional regulator